jgi:hypothetical protein
VSFNLIQSAFTNWCPMMTILRWLGVEDEKHDGESTRRLESATGK